ncbi:bifunctional phosphoglucose/phosphomannose isomerase [Candidatus Poribacteria bacterium]|nr:bifunctional phosphoglucose/phosphomannose isomerase [Candidatus Poribacteria bacterium]
MKILDNIDKMKDKSNMRQILLDFDQQCLKASKLIENIKIPPEYKDVDNIVTSGMGGSAIGGDLMRSLFADSCEIPVVVNRNYTVPTFVNERTLFMAASYSGNTEETLSAFKSAQIRGAKLISMSSGGQLKELSNEFNNPHIEIPLKGIQPRCALGYLFIPMMMALSKLEFIPEQDSHLQEAIDLISDTAKKISPEIPTSDNKAKKLAKKIHGKMPVIYASQNKFDIVAMRWKGQFNENSKAVAFYNAIPEMNHNEIVGWGIPEKITKKSIVLILKDKDDMPQISKRMAITSDLIKETGAKVKTINTKGNSPLAKALYLIYLGDFTSFYLAALNDVDPTPIERISLFKEMLTK